MRPHSGGHREPRPTDTNKEHLAARTPMTENEFMDIKKKKNMQDRDVSRQTHNLCKLNIYTTQSLTIKHLYSFVIFSLHSMLGPVRATRRGKRHAENGNDKLFYLFWVKFLAAIKYYKYERRMLSENAASRLWIGVWRMVRESHHQCSTDVALTATACVNLEQFGRRQISGSAKRTIWRIDPILLVIGEECAQESTRWIIANRWWCVSTVDSLVSPLFRRITKIVFDIVHDWALSCLCDDEWRIEMPRNFAGIWRWFRTKPMGVSRKPARYQ